MANSEELLAQNDIAAYVYVATKSAVGALASSDSPVACAFGVAPADASSLPCLTVVPLNANPVEKRYLDGSFVANCAFAFVLRTLETSEEGLLKVRSFLEKVVKQLEAGFPIGEGRQLWVVSADGLPHCIEDGAAGGGETAVSASETSATAEAFSYSDWRVTLSVTYRVLA